MFLFSDYVHPVCFFMVSCRAKGENADKMNAASLYSKSMHHFLKKTFNTENPVIIDWPECSQGSPAGTEKPEENEVNYVLLCSNK